jgi:hypothetical protein
MITTIIFVDAWILDLSRGLLVILSYFYICSCIIHLVHHLYEYDFSLFYHIGYDLALFDYVLNYIVLNLP